jgi:hypothetical protein
VKSIEGTGLGFKTDAKLESSLAQLPPAKMR